MRWRVSSPKLYRPVLKCPPPSWIGQRHCILASESQRRLLPLLPSCVSATSYADENKNQLVETGTANFQFSHRRNLNLTHYSHLLSSVLRYTFDHVGPTCRWLCPFVIFKPPQSIQPPPLLKGRRIHMVLIPSLVGRNCHFCRE